jgi:simple sugar transport system ATP-binding protein
MAMGNGGPPLIDVQSISKHFGSVIALREVSMTVRAGEVMCLLGDNGAGKSTLIKTLSGVHKPSEGQILVEGKRVEFDSPRDALDAGIATVYQDLAMIPLMSITRNFFMGREPTTGWGPLRRFNIGAADRVARGEMKKIGIDVRDPQQAVGTLSGGERQCVAIARAVYFGAKVLILDEPTSALGVKQASTVLRYIAQARARNLGVIFITHNVHHAYPVGDAFTMLNRGRTLGTFRKGEVTREEVWGMISDGRDLPNLPAKLEEFARADDEAGAPTAASEHELARSLTEEARRAQAH